MNTTSELVYSNRNATMAQLVRDHLVGAGIGAEIRNEQLANLAGELPMTECFVEVWVAKQDANKAGTLVSEVLAQGDGPDVNCPRCGEENGSAFELCWSCGVDLTTTKPA